MHAAGTTITTPGKLRPLSIASAWCRNWAAAGYKHKDTEDWIQTWIHPSTYSGRPGLTADDAAAHILDHTNHGYIATLDLTQAFDHLTPQIGLATMTHLGMAQPTAQLLADIWSDQHRHLTSDQHINCTSTPGHHFDPTTRQLEHARAHCLPAIRTAPSPRTLAELEASSLWTTAPGHRPHYTSCSKSTPTGTNTLRQLACQKMTPKPNTGRMALHTSAKPLLLHWAMHTTPRFTTTSPSWESRLQCVSTSHTTTTRHSFKGDTDAHNAYRHLLQPCLHTPARDSATKTPQQPGTCNRPPRPLPKRGCPHTFGPEQ